jgi:hypothetical protein
MKSLIPFGNGIVGFNGKSCMIKYMFSITWKPQLLPSI